MFAAYTACEKACTTPNTHLLRLPGQGPTFQPMFEPFRGPFVTQTRIVPGSRLEPDLFNPRALRVFTAQPPTSLEHLGDHLVVLDPEPVLVEALVDVDREPVE